MPTSATAAVVTSHRLGPAGRQSDSDHADAADGHLQHDHQQRRRGHVGRSRTASRRPISTAPHYQAGGRSPRTTTGSGRRSTATTVNNSINGLFVRIATPAGNELQPLTVSGRFDDIDIVHVLAENLEIQGSAAIRCSIDAAGGRLITFTPRGGGRLSAGDVPVQARLRGPNGFEGRPSQRRPRPPCRPPTRRFN